MNEESLKQIIQEILESRRFKVNFIEETAEEQTPDFEIIGKSDKYTVELKTKEDDDGKRSREIDKLLRGEVVGKVVPIGPRNTLAGIIKEGKKQIIEHDPHGDTFGIIWLHAAGSQPKLHFERFKNTLFGLETLFSIQPGSPTFECYYFYESAFYTFRDSLDGAILTCITDNQLELQLCINTLSNRVQAFRESELVKALCKVPWDPDELAMSSEGVMIADCSIDRKKPNDVIQYLQKKYNLDHLQTIPMKSISAEVWVPKTGHNND